jgi:hypothetical protein
MDVQQARSLGGDLIELESAGLAAAAAPEKDKYPLAV